MMRLKLSFALILLMLGLIISSASHAESQKELQNPTPSSRVSGKPEQKNPTASSKYPQQDERGTENRPLSIGTVTTQKTDKEAAEDREERDKKALNDLMLNIVTGAQSGFTFILIVVAVLQLLLFWRQLDFMNDTLKASKLAAEAAFLTANHMQTIERAYIRISHMMPPGMTFNDLAEAMYGQARIGEVWIEVKNIGNTTAIITSVVKTSFVLSQNEPLPLIPSYDSRDTERPEVITTMYRSESMTAKFKITLSAQDWAMINDEGGKLYLLIYADYIDQFGVRHRSGYARRYEPRGLDNLVLVTQRDYNYDRKRQQGEGDDWDDTV